MIFEDRQNTETVIDGMKTASWKSSYAQSLNKVVDQMSSDIQRLELDSKNTLSAFDTISNDVINLIKNKIREIDSIESELQTRLTAPYSQMTGR